MQFILYNQWSELPDSANKLFAEGEQKSLFLSRIWLETLSAHALTNSQSILFACVVENSRFLAILPLLEDTQNGLRSLSSHFTTLHSLLLSDRDRQNAILTCLAEGLANHLAQTDNPAILLEPIDSKDGKMIQVQEFMESYGFSSHPYFRFFNWVHRLNGQTFDEYMAERPAHLRNTIRRKKRKLQHEHGYDIRLYKDMNADHSLADKAITDYQNVYQTSWKTNEFFSEFTPNLVKSLFELGWSRVGILYINEQPVAAQLWFVVHGKANIYRLAFDEHWKRYSPGSILTQYLMRYVIDTDKVSEIDFLTGNEKYKQDWMTIRKKCIGIRLAKQAKQKNSFSRAMHSLKKLTSRN